MTPSSPLLLVPTKLTAPSPSLRWVLRKRLLDRLTSIVHTHLTVVIAPAGFGKSTLVAQWLQLRAEGGRLRAEGAESQPSALSPQPFRFAWLTLDEYDQDGLRFLTYVAGAILKAFPHALPTAFPLLTAQEPPPLYIVLQALLVDLSTLPGSLTLVLDDYHAITAEPIHQAVAYLLRRLPPTCHVVILSRMDPPFALARLRAEQQLTELRASDLRFTRDETEVLLTSLLDRPFTPAFITSVQQETEGWALALQLTALAQREASTLDAITGIARQQVAEYLANEVVDQQTAPIQAALLILAVPERFCADLYAALLGSPDDLVPAEDRIRQLVHANLLLIPLDDEGRWYRFHQLFRDLLLRRVRLQMAPQEVAALELRAARWLEAAGLFEEALRHYRAAGAETAAAEIVERLLLPRLGRDQRGLPPDAWLRMLPTALVARRPGLVLLQARRATLTLDLERLGAHLRQLDTLMDDQEVAVPWPGFAADREALWGALHFWAGRPAEAVVALRAALTQDPVPWVAVQALVLLGQALVALGRADEAVQLVDRFLAGGADPARELVACFCRCGISMHAGELDAVTREAHHLHALATAAELDPIWGTYAEAFLAGAAYERAELTAAAEHYRAVVQHREQANPATYMGSLVALALIAIATGDVAGAADYEQAAWSYAAEVGGRFLWHQAVGLATRVALARSDTAAALRAAEAIGPDIHLGMSLWTATPRLSQARALLAAGSAPALAEADTMLAACLAEVTAQRNVPLLVHTLALQARLRQAQGRAGEAREVLAQALQIAEPHGLAWAFLEGGPDLVPLLRTLDAQQRGTPFVQRLLGRMGAPAPETHPLPAVPHHLPELLTRREHEILALLAERWSDKEIAARLVIAPNTVRKHASTIFGKLGVSSRREAGEAARSLGLLPKTL